MIFTVPSISNQLLPLLRRNKNGLSNNTSARLHRKILRSYIEYIHPSVQCQELKISLFWRIKTEHDLGIVKMWSKKYLVGNTVQNHKHLAKKRWVCQGYHSMMVINLWQNFCKSTFLTESRWAYWRCNMEVTPEVAFEGQIWMRVQTRPLKFQHPFPHSVLVLLYYITFLKPLWVSRSFAWTWCFSCLGCIWLQGCFWLCKGLQSCVAAVWKGACPCL